MSALQNTRLKQIVSIAVMVLVSLFVVKSLSRNYAQLTGYQLSISTFPLVFSFALLLVNYLFAPLMWQAVLEGLGLSLPFKNSFGIFYLSQLGKYVPGKLWSYLGVAYLARKQGINEKRALLSAVLLQLLMILGSIYAFLASLAIWPQWPLSYRAGALLAIVATAMFLLRSSLPTKGINFVLCRIFKEEPLEVFPWRQIRRVLILFIPNWLCYGVAYYFFINSLAHVGALDVARLTGLYAISWVVGYFCFIAPAGIGVREGAQVYLFNLFLPLPVSIALAIASRVWLTVGEVAAALVSLVLMRGALRRREET